MSIGAKYWDKKEPSNSVQGTAGGSPLLEYKVRERKWQGTKLGQVLSARSWKMLCALKDFELYLKGNVKPTF